MKNKDFKVILGSQSIWRKRILEKMGYEFEVMVAGIDEKQIRFEDPVKLTLALAKAKAEAILPKIKTEDKTVLITSDQVVFCNGKILEKPENEKEARTFFDMYAKYPAETVTSVFVINTFSGKKTSGTDIAKIWLDPMPQNVIDEYIGTNDPFLHAGGFDHEYPIVSPYVNRIDGETESISGLPVKLTDELIKLVI